MAAYFWVGGAGTWDTTTKTNWAATSGGTGGLVGPPTSADTVTIDTSSGTGTITCTAGVCSDLTVTATQAIILGAASSTLSVFGNLTFPSGGSFSASTNANTITFASTTTGKTITTNGKSLSSTNFNGVGGGWTLGSALSQTAGINLTNGTLDTSSVSNYSITATSIALGAGTKQLNLNASSVSLNGSGTVISFASNGTGLTLNAGTSTITLSSTGFIFAGGGFTFYNVTSSSTALSASNASAITGANTFNNFTLTSLAADGMGAVTIGANQTINGTLTLGTANTAVRRFFIRSDITGTQRTITAATVATLSDIDFRDIAFSASQSGTRLGDCGGNTNITFPAAKTVYWNLTGTQNWAATAWATSSGGTPAANNFPLAQDTAVFDNSGSAGTITTAVVWNLGTIDMSTRTTAFTFTINVNNNIYGSITLFSNLTVSGTGTLIFAGRGTQTITSAGRTLTQSISIDNGTGTTQLADAIIITGTAAGLTFLSGTFNAVSYNVTTTFVTGAGTVAKILSMGSGTWTITSTGSTIWNFATIAPFTFNKGTANIVLSDTSTSARSFGGGGFTYNKLTIGGTTGISQTTITGANTFSELASTKTVAHTITFGTTGQTFTTWSVKGTAGNVVTVNSSAVGTQRAITVTNKTDGIDYLSIIDVNGTNVSPYTFYAGANSTNAGNNTGIAFIASSTASSQTAYLLTTGTTFTIPADWNSSSNAIYMLGAGGGGGNSAVSGNNRAAGGGCGGGGYTKVTNFSSSPSSSITYAIGTSVANTDGGDTTWNSGAYTAGGGKKGTAATTPTSAGGAGGTGSTYNGGQGGAGAFGTTASQGYGSGGGGGAAGTNGVGANGGTGFGSTTAANIAGGGGGGNGGGSNGGNAASATFGSGGNNFGGTGGGATTGANGTFGGGGAGVVNTGTGGSGGSGIDILNTIGGGGGKGGSTTLNTSTNSTSLYGAGGGGGPVTTVGGALNGGAGSQGVIFIVYSPGAVTITNTNYFLLF